MAWNEPGGRGDKDPWGSRGGDNKNSPGLDEAFKKFLSKLDGIFGGGKSRSGGGGPSPIDNAGKLLPLVGIVIAVVWAFSGLYTVEEGKQAVVLQFGAYKELTGPGLHWYPRFVQTVETVDVSRIQKSDIGVHASARGASDRGSLMLTQDENIVDVEMSVQYKVKNAKDYLFNVADPDVTLRQAMESALREIIGKSTMDFVITEGRGEIGQRAETMVQQILDRYQTGLVVTSVNLQGARAPDQVRSAFDDAVKAREDEQRLKNEAEAYSNDIIPKARGAAARQLEDANAYKSRVIAHAEGEAVRFTKVLAEYTKEPTVTRERLYLEMAETVLGATSKIVVDVPGGNNMVYLPLDKFLDNQRSAASAADAAFPDSVPPASTAESPAARSAVGEQRERSRNREAR